MQGISPNRFADRLASAFDKSARRALQILHREVAAGRDSSPGQFNDDFFLIQFQVETVEVHHLGPRVDEVMHELLACVVRGIDLGHSA